MNPLSRSQLTISICMFFRHPDLWPVIWDPPLPTSNGFMLNVFAYATDPCQGLLPSSSAFGEFLLTLQNSSLRVTCSGEHSTTCVSKFPSSSNSLAFRDTPGNTEQNGQLSGSWIQTQVWRHQSRCPSLILACVIPIYLIPRNRVFETGICVFYNRKTCWYALCRSPTSGRWQQQTQNPCSPAP